MTSIERIEVPIPIRALRTANVYVVDTGNIRVLVDTGMTPDVMGQIVDGIGSRNIDYIFVTHLHVDHIGNAGLLSEKLDSKLIIGRRDLERIRQIQKNPESFRELLTDVFRKFGVPDETIMNITGSHSLNKNISMYMDFNPDICVDRSLNLGREIEILENPGHSPGSCSMIIRGEDSIMTGDHVLPGITPNISFYDTETDSLGDYMNSLRKTAELDLSKVYPGHREPFIGLGKRCNEILRHHVSRLHEVYDLVASPSTGYSVACGMRWSRGRTLASMNSTEQNFAIGETMTHIMHLEKKGYVERDERGGISFYNQAAEFHEEASFL